MRCECGKEINLNNVDTRRCLYYTETEAAFNCTCGKLLKVYGKDVKEIDRQIIIDVE